MKSILFPEETFNKHKLLNKEPDYFRDLNLDQIVDVIAGKQEYLKPFFYTPLHDISTIKYRHEIMKDFENDIKLYKRVKTFSQSIQFSVMRVKSILSRIFEKESYHSNYVEKGKLLETAETYCEEIKALVSDIKLFKLKSQGLISFMNYVETYSKSDYFKALCRETIELKKMLKKVHYCMLIKENCIKVRKYEDEPNYNIEIEKVFDKFKDNNAAEHTEKLTEEPYAEHVEAGVLNLVAKLYPDIFSKLDKYIIENKNFLDETILTFTKEVQFYICYLQYISKFKQAGLKFCYPEMSRGNKEIYDNDFFDMALAYRLIDGNGPVVCNDFYLKGKERIIVVSGPNQGGKTTFARAFGQINHLACIGCPIAGKKAELFLSDRIFTHFEREENIKSKNGKLQDELIRMHDILSEATPYSIIIVNEILASTTLNDAVFIGEKIMKKLVELDLISLWVTFIDELASLTEKNVSMISTVVKEDPSKRTYKIVRSPADGLVYALNIAEKYKLTYNCLKERIR